MTHGSLFSGIGGFDLAAQTVGWENIFNCEIDSFCQKVLQYHFPNSQQHYDITTTNFKQYKGTIDVVSGGFPCQPFSVAGKRKGTNDHRFLWGEMFRAIREIEPQWVVAENVRGLISQQRGVVFERVQSDLEAIGYEVQPFIIPACAVGAPHRRDRVWIIAHSANARLENLQSGRQNGISEFGTVAHADSARGNSRWRDGFRSDKNTSERSNLQFEIDRFGKEWLASDTAGIGRQQNNESEPSKQFAQSISDGYTPNANRILLQNRHKVSQKGRQEKERIKPRCSSEQWKKFPTQSPICGGDDGLSIELDGITFSKWRAESIKAYGNAIVPQIAMIIFQIIKQIEQQK